jgi:hypothetical protein
MQEIQDVELEQLAENLKYDINYIKIYKNLVSIF